MPTETKSRKGIGGPKTDEGKERIRLNALNCGQYANSLEAMQAVSDVIGVSFVEMLQKMLDYYKPADPIEETLIRRIARCSWRLIVIEKIEDSTLEGLELRDAPDEALECLSIMERRIDGPLHRAISVLTAKRRREQEPTPIPNSQFSTLNSQFPSCPSCSPLLNDEQENMKNKLNEAERPPATAIRNPQSQIPNTVAGVSAFEGCDYAASANETGLPSQPGNAETCPPAAPVPDPIPHPVHPVYLVQETSSDERDIIGRPSPPAGVRTPVSVLKE